MREEPLATDGYTADTPFWVRLPFGVSFALFIIFISLISSHSPVQSRLVAARFLTAPGALKRVLHVELSLPAHVTYAPGDALGVHVSQSRTEVDALLARLMVDDARASARVRLVARTAATSKASKASGARGDFFSSFFFEKKIDFFF